MILAELLEAIGQKTLRKFGKRVIGSVCNDSRKVDATSLFVCVEGVLVDGHDYALMAYNRGCRVFVAQKALDLPENALVFLVPDTRKALAELSAKFYDYPHKQLRLIGITGTKGKTTTALLIRHILDRNGIPTGYIGSNGIDYLDTHIETINTTPESCDLHKYMRQMVEAGIRCLAMEVSSQSVFMNRIWGLSFDICVFTNLSPDHIGEREHPTFEHYRACKQALFTDFGARYVVYNADDPAADGMIQGTSASHLLSYSQEKAADLQAEKLSLYRDERCLGEHFECRTSEGVIPVTVPLPGAFSVYNATAAMAVCSLFDLSLPSIAEAMATAAIKGRFEIVHALPDVTFVLDYAHNGVSLRSALNTLRLYRPERLICLFGSVGGRTVMRRPELGRAAAELADFCILTSDNPDRESPEQIIDQIAESFGNDSCPYVKIPSREEAIAYAVRMARPGDIFLLAGKGHEDYQLVRGQKLPFSERALILAAAEERKILL